MIHLHITVYLTTEKVIICNSKCKNGSFFLCCFVHYWLVLRVCENSFSYRRDSKDIQFIKRLMELQIDTLSLDGFWTYRGKQNHVYSGYCNTFVTSTSAEYFSIIWECTHCLDCLDFNTHGVWTTFESHVF